MRKTQVPEPLTKRWLKDFKEALEHPTSRYRPPKLAVVESGFDRKGKPVYRTRRPIEEYRALLKPKKREVYDQFLAMVGVKGGG